MFAEPFNTNLIPPNDIAHNLYTSRNVKETISPGIGKTSPGIEKTSPGLVKTNPGLGKKNLRHINTVMTMT